jgi:hypothetical protein
MELRDWGLTVVAAIGVFLLVELGKVGVRRTLRD